MHKRARHICATAHKRKRSRNSYTDRYIQLADDNRLKLVRSLTSLFSMKWLLFRLCWRRNISSCKCVHYMKCEEIHRFFIHTVIKCLRLSLLIENQIDIGCASIGVLFESDSLNSSIKLRCFLLTILVTMGVIHPYISVDIEFVSQLYHSNRSNVR